MAHPVMFDDADPMLARVRARRRHDRAIPVRPDPALTPDERFATAPARLVRELDAGGEHAS